MTNDEGREHYNETMPAAAVLERIAAAEHADPASDDLTIPLAIENAALATEIGRLTADRDNSNALLDACRLERNVLQKICAERSDEIERLREALNGKTSAPTIDDVPSCGSENDYRNARASDHDGRKPG